MRIGNKIFNERDVKTASIEFDVGKEKWLIKVETIHYTYQFWIRDKNTADRDFDKLNFLISGMNKGITGCSVSEL